MSEVVETIRRKYLALREQLNESARRRWAATEARELGRGGIARVAKATGMSPATIRAGLVELDTPPTLPPAPRGSWGGARKKGQRNSEPARVRAPGGGRKPVTVKDPALLPDLDRLIDPKDSGELPPALRWTTTSTRELARLLREQGHRVSQQKVAELLHELGYRLQAPQQHPGGRNQRQRDLQFERMYAAVREFRAAGQPVIAVDVRKTPLDQSQDETAGGVDDISMGARAGARTSTDLPGSYRWISRTESRPPQVLAVETIRIWWETMGRETHPKAKHLLIAGPGGGITVRSLHWKLGIQRLANDTGLVIHVCQHPSGTSKWNHIEQRLSIRTNQEWPGGPPDAYDTVVSLVKTVERPLDDQKSGIGAPQDGVAASQPTPGAGLITHEMFDDDWNYVILPNSEPEAID